MQQIKRKAYLSLLQHDVKAYWGGGANLHAIQNVALYKASCQIEASAALFSKNKSPAMRLGGDYSLCGRVGENDFLPLEGVENRLSIKN
jgi:hypothetical protein